MKNQLKVVMVGHVDHGKSTVIGRLLADSGSLPGAKLAEIQSACRKNAKPYEYAFLLDALKDERSQGITIDVARCFLKTARRNYQIIDAPGHIEFLKKMISGAALAEAAFLVIDAEEGIQENSKRHGYLLSMLGIKQLSVLINKMDLIGYSRQKYDELTGDYRKYLRELRVEPISFIPICACNGDNVAAASTRMPWYQGPTVLEQLDAFEEETGDSALDFRFPVQDVYKFTEHNDKRRILAGTLRAGAVSVGEEIEFYPSFKKAKVKTIEAFNSPVKTTVQAGEAVGLTLDEEIYVQPGELAAKTFAQVSPQVGTRIKVNLFWMGKNPLIKHKPYKLKINTARATLYLRDVLQVVDSSDLSTIENKLQVDQWDMAECILETAKPIAFDAFGGAPRATGRFVIVDNYEIAGWGVILDGLDSSGSVFTEKIKIRESDWKASSIRPEERSRRFRHAPCVIVVMGISDIKRDIAARYERYLFDRGMNAYYLRLANLRQGLDADILNSREQREEILRRFGELARILTDAGQILISSLHAPDKYDLQIIKELITPFALKVVNVDMRDFKGFPVDVTLDLSALSAFDVRKLDEGLNLQTRQ